MSHFSLPLLPHSIVLQLLQEMYNLTRYQIRIHTEILRTDKRMNQKTTRFTKSLFLISLLTLVLVSGETKAQGNGYKGFEHWYIGLNLGTSKFYGDVSGRTSSFSNANPFSGSLYRDRDFMYGITLTKRFSGIFWTRFNLLAGALDAQENDLNLYFKSDIVEFSGVAMLSLSDIIGGADPQRRLNVYTYAGAGLLSYRAWKRQLANDSLIDTEGTGKHKASDFIIPMGIGVDYRINGQFTITGELSLRNVRSDRLDAHASVNAGQEGYGYINIGAHYQFDMPEGLFRGSKRYNGKSSDPALKAYNKRKATIMKTDGYRKGLRTKRKLERARKEWVFLKFFRKTHLDMATE